MDGRKFCYQLIITISICDILGFLKSKHEKFREFFATGTEKKPFKSARDGVTIQFYHLGMMCTVLLHCPISVEIRTVDSQSDL